MEVLLLITLAFTQISGQQEFTWSLETNQQTHQPRCTESCLTQCAQSTQNRGWEQCYFQCECLINGESHSQTIQQFQAKQQQQESEQTHQEQGDFNFLSFDQLMGTQSSSVNTQQTSSQQSAYVRPDFSMDLLNEFLTYEQILGQQVSGQQVPQQQASQTTKTATKTATMTTAQPVDMWEGELFSEAQKFQPNEFESLGIDLTSINLFDPFGMSKTQTKTIIQPKEATVTKKSTVTVATPQKVTVTETTTPSVKVTVGPKEQKVETIGTGSTVTKTSKTATTTASTSEPKTLTVDPVKVAKSVVTVDKSASVSVPKTTTSEKTETITVTKSSVELSAAEQQKQDRMAASAIAHYLLQQNMGLIEAGDWKTASANIVAETLKLDSVDIQMKVAEIFQQLINDYKTEVSSEKEVTIDKEVSIGEAKGSDSKTVDIKVDVSGVSVKTPVSVTEKTVSIKTEPESVGLKTVKETKEVTVSTKDLVGGQVKSITKVESGVKVTDEVSDSDKTVVTKTTTTSWKKPAPTKTYVEEKRVTDSIKSAISDIYKHLEYSVTVLPWFTAGQKVIFTMNDFETNFYILVHFREDGSYHLVVIDEATSDILSVFAAILILDEHSLSGIDVELIETRADSETHEFLSRFSDMKSAYLIKTKKLSSVAKSAALYSAQEKLNVFHSISLNETDYDSWEVAITKMSGFSSTSHVTAYKGNETTNFHVLITEFSNLPGAYFVTIQLPDGQIQRLDVLSVYDNDLSLNQFQTVVMIRNDDRQNLKVDLKTQPDFAYDATSVVIKTWNEDMESLVKKYRVIKDVILVNEEVVAGTMGLVRYLYNTDYQDIIIRKVTDTLKGARLEVLLNDESILVDSVQVEYGELDTMFTLFLKDLDDSVSNYNVVVRAIGAGQYEVSILLDTTIIATYQVDIVSVDGQDAYKVGGIREVNESGEIIKQISTYKQYVLDDKSLLSSVVRTLDEQKTCDLSKYYECEKEATLLETAIEVSGAVKKVNETKTTVVVNKTIEIVNDTVEPEVDEKEVITTEVKTISRPEKKVGEIEEKQEITTEVKTIPRPEKNETEIKEKQEITTEVKTIPRPEKNETEIVEKQEITTEVKTIPRPEKNETEIEEKQEITTEVKTIPRPEKKVGEIEEKQEITTEVKTIPRPVKNETEIEEKQEITTEVKTIPRPEKQEAEIEEKQVITTEVKTIARPKTIQIGQSEVSISSEMTEAEQQQATEEFFGATFSFDTSIKQLEMEKGGDDFSIVQNPVTEEKYKVYINGSVYDWDGNLITEDGMEGLVVYLSFLLQSTRVGNYLIAINPLNGDKYHVYDNGTVYDEAGNYVVDGGMIGLTQYLTIRRTVGSVEYKLVQNPLTGENLKAWENDTVTTLDGVVITHDGITGLQKMLSERAALLSRIEKIEGGEQFDVGYAQFVMGDGTEFTLHNDGVAYDSSGVQVSSGGIAELQAFITSAGYSLVSIYEPSVDIVSIEGTQYAILESGEVYERYSSTVLTTGGIEGLKAYLIELRKPKYRTINAGGNLYRVYDNGTVTDNSDVFVTVGGVEGLTAYLTELATPDYQIISAGGVQYKVYNNGSVYDENDVFIVTGGVEALQAYLTELATPDYKVVKVEDKEFRVYNNGTVTDEFDVFVVEGGVPALTEYLTANPQLLLLYQDEKFLASPTSAQSTWKSALALILTLIIVLSLIFYYQRNAAINKENDVWESMRSNPRQPLLETFMEAQQSV